MSRYAFAAVTKTIATAVSAAALAGMLTVAAPREANACAAGKVATTAGAAFIKAARARSARAFAAALRKHTNLTSISMFALGRYRKQLRAGQRTRFVQLSGRYIARTLADFSAKFRAESIRIERCSASKVESNLLQLGGRPPQKVIWRISGGKITDVNVQNVWLAQLLRSNFASIIKKGGGNITALFKALGGAVATASKTDKN